MRHQLPLHYLDTVARVGSIRKAAEQLAITSSALNRRIIAMEQDIGVPLFDRVAKGVRLNAAGELLIHHFRTQLADMERVKSHINDLQGVRRGHIAIACSQALMVSVLPSEIHRYRAQHPEVTFGLRVCTRQTATSELQSFNADLAVVFEPELTPDFQTIMSVPQQLYAQFCQSHELQGEGAVRLWECLQWPLALPTKNNGVRHLIERSAANLSSLLDVAIESDNFYLLRTLIQQSDLVSFTVAAGLPKDQIDSHLDSRPVDLQDVPAGMLHIGQLKGRHLSVAASKFLEQLTQTLEGE